MPTTFSLANITTKDQAEELLDRANEQKMHLDNDIRELTYEQTNTTNTAQKVAQTLSEKQISIQFYTTALADPNLTNKKIRKDYERKREKLENRIQELSFRQEDVGVNSLIRRECMLARTNAEVEILNALIAQLEALLPTLT